ncbi:glutathione peroxidase [Tepidamorphus sp. 3E244]|uniref:glutathione peroxidase n=1 Tax=Tepidamorphus sp. 3E244 TaxID=3385498 RepID=UPI0038FCBE21
MSQRTVSAFNLTTLEGEPLPLSRHDGKVILLVNTASRCGFTHQFAGLQELYERFAEQGLLVIGVPSNDFNQELGKAEDIRKVCSGSYGVSFPMTAKASVKGTDATPLYRWLRDELGSENAPRWNFHKYLIGRDGRPHKAYPSHVRPTAGEVVAEIERLLAQPGA